MAVALVRSVLFSLAWGSARGDSCVTISQVSYSCASTTCDGYLAHPPSCTSSSKCPAVMILPDWTGLDAYEKERARMLADLGYVAFAADIYGRDTPQEDLSDWVRAALTHEGTSDLFMTKMNVALSQVRSQEHADTSKVAVLGYGSGGSGVVSLALLGKDVLGVVGYHSDIKPAERVSWDGRTNNATVMAKVLLHSGANDDDSTDVGVLEQELEAAGATYEIISYGSNVFSGFTDWSARSPGSNMYSPRADYRSWESTKLFLQELFSGLPAAERGPENPMLHTALQNYSCSTTTCQGYLAYNTSHCTDSSPCPAVVIIQDWTGMDEYEKERARMLAELGYVAFAADIYGFGTPVENMADWGAAAGAHRGNPDLYMAKINAALEQLENYDYVNSSQIAVVGYCFGGSGVVNMAILGFNVSGVVGYHSGIDPNSRVVRSSSSDLNVGAKVLLHSGVDDDAWTDVGLLMDEFEAANAKYEIVRYGKDVFHSFTEWNANFPGQAIYDHRADYRSWESTKLFLQELFLDLPDAERGPALCPESTTVTTSTSEPEVEMNHAATAVCRTALFLLGTLVLF